MIKKKLKICVIFGGTGFIGCHFASHLLKISNFDQVILADIAEPRTDFYFNSSKIKYVKIDVRQSPSVWKLPSSVDLIANFAAIHREPGHDLHEYYETNIPGAENVCAWAELVNCRNILFTSSIAPYGSGESEKHECSIPSPTSGYGGSKLVAEKIHLCWQRASTGRRLVIVRPGVVFGPGERGNVSRLVRATIHRYFIYMGNKNTRKAGGYVKELPWTMLWALNQIPDLGGSYLYNFCMPKPLTVQDYVQATCQVAGVNRLILSCPYHLILGFSYIFEFYSILMKMKLPISPTRIKKLVRSNNIKPEVLTRNHYEFQYTLITAMQDWKKDRPDEWC